MSLYVLDTDILTLFDAGHALVNQRVLAQSAGSVVITVFSVEEQLSGWYTLMRQAKKRAELLHAYHKLAESVPRLARWRILEVTAAAMARYDHLKSLKLKIGNTDLRIAAVTLENAATLVTRNVSDFQKIPNLPIENWAV